MHKTLQFLKPIDILILTLIFFGEAIISSTYGYLQLTANHQVAPDTLVFNGDMNLAGIAKECIILAVAFVYLWLRKFNFKRFNFNINRTTPIKILTYILIAGLVATSYEYLQMWFAPNLYPSVEGVFVDQSYSADEHFSQMSLSLFVFAILNGFFEELYFLGIIFAVHKKYLWLALLFSLFVRFSFHTYQGLAGAFVVTTLGVVFLALRLKDDELLAFMLAHSFFDVLGLGLPLYLLDF